MTDWIPDFLLGDYTLLVALAPLGAILMALRRFAGLSFRTLAAVAAVGLLLLLWVERERQQEHIAFLEDEQEKLLTAVNTQEQTIDELQAIIVNWRERYEALQEALNRQEGIADAAREELARTRQELKDDNLSGQAEKDPGGVEKILNSRTNSAMCRLQRASGADPGDDCR